MWMTADQAEAIRVSRMDCTLRVAEEIRSFTAPARGRGFAKRKRTLAGKLTHRLVFNFEWPDRARQRLLLVTLTPFVSFHPSQTLLRWGPDGRGRSAACKTLHRLLGEVPDSHVFVQLDIRDFFGSIRHEWLEAKLALAKEVIRRHVHTGGMILSYTRIAEARLPDGVIEELVRRGLPQGSALSSLIAEWVMADVLEELADRLRDVHLITYSDNIGILAPISDAAVIEELLREAFRSHDAGPFDLTSSGPQPVGRDFKFLGLWWRVREGKPEVFVPGAVASAWEGMIGGEVLTADTKSLHRLAAAVKSKCAEWEMWEGALELREHLLALISVAHASLGRVDRDRVADQTCPVAELTLPRSQTARQNGFEC